MLLVGVLDQSASPPTGFITRWTVAGDASARTIRLPLAPARIEGALSYNCTVDWGDGSPTATVTAWNDLNATHTYAIDGTYDVEIQGTCEGWSVNYDASIRSKLVAVINWGSASLFDGFKYLKGGFWGCNNLTSLGTGPILASGAGIGADGFNSTFSGCQITSIPPGLFNHHAAMTTDAFNSTFGACSVLTSIPTDLFAQAALASTNAFMNVFSQCTSLASIPTDLFRYNTAASSGAFQNAFQQCSSLTFIPIDLFRYNTLVSSNGAFRQTFYQCTSLTSIPVDLFRYNALVTDNAFRSCFYGCTSLTSIPADLFRYNTLVSTTGFRSTFNGCTSLTSIPADLFRHNTANAAGVFQYAFYECVKLRVNRNIFYADGERTTRFLDQSPDFSNCFNRSSFTGAQGEAPDLWNCSFGTGVPVETTCFGGAGNDLVSLSNYADIPVEWK